MSCGESYTILIRKTGYLVLHTGDDNNSVDGSGDQRTNDVVLISDIPLETFPVNVPGKNYFLENFFLNYFSSKLYTYIICRLGWS